MLMKRNNTFTAGLLSALMAFPVAGAIAAGGGISVPPARAAVPELSTVVGSNIKDLSATLRVIDTNFDELGKIDANFKRSYYFKRMDITYQYPSKIRLVTKVAGIQGVLVFNGDTRFYRIPLKKEKTSVAGQPGQKQSLLQLGIFAKDYLELDYEPHFQRQEKGLLVYKLTQRNTNNGSHEFVWVNPKTHIIEKRVSYNGDNVLRMETRYKEARQVRPGVYLPTRIEVYNQFGKLAGVQALEEIKVNLGVDEALFATE